MRIKKDSLTLAFIALQFAAALAVSLFARTGPEGGDLLLSVCLYIVVFLLPIIIYIRAALCENPPEYLKISKNVKTGFLYGFAISAFVLLAFLIVNRFSTDVEALKASAFVAVLAGPFEEIPFRGFYLREFSGRWGFVRANILSSAMFAALHLQALGPNDILRCGFLFFVGLWLGYIYKKSDSLWAPVIVHSAYNALTVIF